MPCGAEALGSMRVRGCQGHSVGPPMRGQGDWREGVCVPGLSAKLQVIHFVCRASWSLSMRVHQCPCMSLCPRASLIPMSCAPVSVSLCRSCPCPCTPACIWVCLSKGQPVLPCARHANRGRPVQCTCRGWRRGLVWGRGLGPLLQAHSVEGQAEAREVGGVGLRHHLRRPFPVGGGPANEGWACHVGLTAGEGVAGDYVVLRGQLLERRR